MGRGKESLSPRYIIPFLLLLHFFWEMRLRQGRGGGKGLSNCTARGRKRRRGLPPPNLLILKASLSSSSSSVGCSGEGGRMGEGRIGAVGGPSSYSSFFSFGGRYKKALGRRKEGVPRGGGGTNKEGRKGLGGDSTDVKRLCTLLVYQLVMSPRGLYICCSTLRFNEHQKSSSRGREMSLNVGPFPSRPRVQQQSKPAAHRLNGACTARKRKEGRRPFRPRS